jgi:transcriptional regulator with XRE-family HTH domain
VAIAAEGDDRAMFGLIDDLERVQRIGKRLRERREQGGLSYTQVARETGVSAGTIRRFEEVAVNGPGEKPMRFEPWGVEYLERWLDDTLTPDIVVKHDLQRVLERDPALNRKQIREILSEFYEIYERVRNRGK